jgi:phage-related protein
MTPEPDPIRLTAAGTIMNAGTVYSQPRITIDADGDFSLTINAQTMFFSGVDDGIILDCALMDAFTADGALLANDQVAGEFFHLDEGANIITWLVESGSEVRSITIEPRWRCI